MTKNLATLIQDDYYTKIADAMQEAFSDYLIIENETINQNANMVFKTRTKASLIHDLLRVKITNAFKDCGTDVTIGEFNGIFGVLIPDVAFIRFKKLSNKFDTSNVQTIQTVDYDYQRDLDGLPKTPVKLYAGYLPNITWTGIQNIYLFCRTGKVISWSMDLTNRVVNQFSMFDEQLDVVEPTAVVTIKKSLNNTEENKTGTNE